MECGADAGRSPPRGRALVDELLLYLAPTLLGSGSHPLADLPAPADMASRTALRILESEPIGGDVRVRAAVEKLGSE